MLMLGKVYAQDSSKTAAITISGYAEAYYSYDFNKPTNNSKANFLYSHSRNNEVNLNLGFIKATYNTDKLRTNLALAAGTYVNANYAAEEGVLKNIYEANAGIKLSKKSSLWLDAGIFASHIGFESAVSKDCWTLTRSVLAENSPYYESGVKLGYTSASNKWFLSGMILNGWQRIKRVDGNSTPVFGTQVTYKPSDAITFNSSTFIGNDKTDSIKQMRYFHNFYCVINPGKAFNLIAGFDYGLEQKSKGSAKMNNWWSPVVIARVTKNNNTLAVRAEYYNDENNLIVSTANGFKTFGWSINYDRQIFNNALWRIELRQLKGKDNYFNKGTINKTDNTTFLTTSLAVSF